MLCLSPTLPSVPPAEKAPQRQAHTGANPNCGPAWMPATRAKGKGKRAKKQNGLRLLTSQQHAATELLPHSGTRPALHRDPEKQYFGALRLCRQHADIDDGTCADTRVCTVCTRGRRATGGFSEIHCVHGSRLSGVLLFARDTVDVNTK